MSSFDVVSDAVDKYPEMHWLTGDVEATPVLGATTSQQEMTLGQQFFPSLSKNDVVEFDRTAVGLLALRWVLDGDYESFTACQSGSSKLSRAGFEQLRAYTNEFVQGDDARREALETFIVINDLGKVKKVVDAIGERTGISDVDHDRILAAGLKVDPGMSPSFVRLTPEYRDMIQRGLETEFNPTQFIQAENVPANLEKLRGLDADGLRLYLLHSLFDLAGAAGQSQQDGSAVMTEETYQSFAMACSALEQLSQGASVEAVYDAYLAERGGQLGLDVSDPRERAITRVCCMMRISDSTEAERISDIYGHLTPNTQAILDKDLNTSGTDDGKATLVYYAPDMLRNFQKTVADEHGAKDFDRAVEMGLTTLARIYQEVRIATKGQQGNGVYTVMASDVTAVAGQDPEMIARSAFSLVPVGADARVAVENIAEIDQSSFPSMPDLSALPGERVAVIGIGGGSDCVQAAAVARLLERTGKETACVISVRNEKTRSQDAAGRLGEKRTVKKHGGEIEDGVYVITPTTEGSGRFLENIVASDDPAKPRTYLVIEREDVELSEQLEAALEDVGDVDTVLAVDTGGDALTSTEGEEISRSTPDQDLRVLNALHKLPEHFDKMTCEIAVGVDAPPEAEETLDAAEAMYYEPSSCDVENLLMFYRECRMDGSDPTRYGKTALAWQTALKEKTGIQDTGLPTDVVLDPQNPWRPFVPVQPAMKGLFFMELDKHLHSIGAIAPPTTAPPTNKTGFGPDLPGRSTTGGGIGPQGITRSRNI